jgi:hypothetical protein
MDIVYAGVLYGLTPVVISATLGSICPALPIPIGIPPPIAAKANPSLGLAVGTDLGVLSLLAAIVLPALTLLPLPLELLWECDVDGRLYREALLEPVLLMTLECDWVGVWPRVGEERWPAGGVSTVTLESEKGTTPARRAISASPSCQCIASAARQGTAISSATLDHISGLNLWGVSFLFERQKEMEG